MTRTSRWVILCSAVLILSGVFARRAADAPLPQRDPKRSATAVVVKGESNTLNQAGRGTEGATREALLATPAFAGSYSGTAQQPTDVTITYPGSRVDRKTIRALHGDEPLSAQHPHMAAAIAVQERCTDQLLAHPAVIGTAVGLNDEGQVAILVMTKAAADDLPRTIENTPLVIWKTGEIFALNKDDQESESGNRKAKELAKPDGVGGGPPDGGSTEPPPPPPPPPITRNAFAHPVPIGVSTSVPLAFTYPYITAGTLGCRVTAGTNVYALSNNHVFADESTVPIGTPILQPGTLETNGVEGPSYGSLYRYAPIVFSRKANNLIDAAITLSDVASLGKSTPTDSEGNILIGYGTPSSQPITAVLGQIVTKVGRTTGSTTGTVSGVNSTVLVRYDHGTARFLNQVMISNIGTTSFSAGGDSGSLIVTNGDFRPLGLLFAGSSTTTFGNPIGAVLSYFTTTVGQTVTVDGQ